MLERIREGSQGPWAMVIIALIVLSFVFAGVGSYITSSASTAAASVNGVEISLNDLERAYQSQRARLEAQYGESAGALFANEGYMQEFRSGVLERMIGDELLRQQAEKLGLRVSDDQIRETITQMPEFQVGGQFNNDRYLALIRQNGFRANDFRDYLRTEMTREQLSRAISASELVLDNEAARVFKLQQQTRDGEYLVIDSAPFAAGVELTDVEIDNFYQANLSLFDTQEKVKVAYVELTVEQLKGTVAVNEDEIATYYEQNQGNYRTEEERRVAHILIEFGEDKDAALTQAQSTLEALRGGADFAETAKTTSADTFSAENGGDLEFITQGMMEPAFDDAAFALAAVGDISDVVETDFGFHIIKLTDIKPEQVTALAEVSEEIRDQLLTDKAMEKFFALQTDMAEIAFEVPDSLQDVAGAINGEVKETGLFTRNNAPAPLSAPAAVSVAFSSELIDDGVNSDLVEINDNHVVVMRVVEHQPQRTQSIDEVRDRIVKQLTDEKAQDAAQAWAQELVSKIEAGDDVAALLTEKSVEWQTASAVTRNGSEMPRNLVTSLFQIAPQEYEVARLLGGDVGVVKLTAVNSPEPSEADNLAMLGRQIAASTSQQLLDSYIKALRADADVEIFRR